MQKKIKETKKRKNYDVELKIYPRYFKLIKNDLKTVELRKVQKAKTGDVIKLTRTDGFEKTPIYRKVYDIYSKYADNLTIYELRRAWTNIDFLYSYLDGDLGKKIYLHDLKKVDKNVR